MHADQLDAASELEQLNIEAALANGARQQLQFTGKCHNCNEPIATGHFCDSDCRDDYEKRQYQNKQRRVG